MYELSFAVLTEHIIIDTGLCCAIGVNMPFLLVVLIHEP